MKKFIKGITLMIVAVMVASLGACATKPGDGSLSTNAPKATEAKIVTMCTNAEFEPFEYKKDNKIVGIDVEISNAIAAKMGAKLEISDIGFDTLIPAIESGKADFAAAGMTATDERRNNVDFSVPYFNASQVIIVLKGSAIKSAADLKDKVLGVQLGTTGDTYCTKEVEAKEIKRFDKGVDAIQDLKSGRVDAVIIDDFPASKFVEKNTDIEKLTEALTVEEYSIAVKKGNKDLLDTINSVITEMKASGKLTEIIGNYITAE